MSFDIQSHAISIDILFKYIYNKKGAFNCSAIKKKNYLKFGAIFSLRLKMVVTKNRRSCILKILEHENRELFFQLVE
ncbi:35292_t:CDS:2, partial [Gigaspora margarita]